MPNAYGFTSTDVLKRFDAEELEQITDGTNAPDETKVNQAIVDGAGEFDGWAARYYVTPVNPLTEAIRTNLLDLIAWRLIFNCKREWLNSDQEKALTWVGRRKELIVWMQGIGSPERKFVLAGCEETSTPSRTKGLPRTVSTQPLMTRAKLGGIV